MRCHFIYDKETKQKVFIPECYGSLYRDDLSGCCCPKRNKSIRQFEKEEYDKTVKALQSDLDYLQKEYNALLRIIEKINK